MPLYVIIDARTGDVFGCAVEATSPADAACRIYSDLGLARHGFGHVSHCSNNATFDVYDIGNEVDASNAEAVTTDGTYVTSLIAYVT
ncbi:hypothetical protein [Methylobacterium gnaphalii]|uniref:Uncharacterized protein n=1 Tax=Methylobacterium gnaphalii TaxID=1010610 RepID=A0A512JRF6_9HYPH|nr:hypothetical protein [Methylobacterium gnaphalii]GEP12492.1 hypothetical protein MGN01_43370 [Methylobacterium gnaphalii]GJD71765.1 hypothetical protein MMMDOFMJ_4730 [Methylobacterium gnaphalii]GLS50612.1 hypothetical protein GCM10007885_34650 [Methylobacterium gnaphalii]